MALRLVPSNHISRPPSARVPASPSANWSAALSTVTKQLREIAQSSPTDLALLMLIVNRVHRRAAVKITAKPRAICVTERLKERGN